MALVHLQLELLCLQIAYQWVLRRSSWLYCMVAIEAGYICNSLARQSSAYLELQHLVILAPSPLLTNINCNVTSVGPKDATLQAKYSQSDA